MKTGRGRDAGSVGNMHGTVACNRRMECGNEWVWHLVGAVSACVRIGRSAALSSG